jgi:hypothetical protein
VASQARNGSWLSFSLGIPRPPRDAR